MNLKVGEHDYTLSGKLDVFAQLHVARKLAPALAVVDGLTHPKNTGKDKVLLVVLMFSQLDDEDSEFVIRKCLSVVMRKQETGFVKIQTSTGQLMFQDISLDELLLLTSTVLEESLGDFFRTALARLGQAAPTL